MGSIDQLEGELDLAGGAGSMADDAEAAAQDSIGRQAEIDDVEDIEKFRAELEDAQFTLSPVANWGVLDQGNIELMKTGSAKGVAAQSAKDA